MPAGWERTYTAGELAALDRALHAGNCTREDLTFRKDMAQGLDCLPLVRALLHEPLRIAVTMDGLAGALRAPPAGEAAGADPVQAALERTLGAALAVFEDEVAQVPLELRARARAGELAALGEAPPAARDAGGLLQDLAGWLERSSAGVPGVARTGEGEAGRSAAQALLRGLPDEMLMREVFGALPPGTQAMDEAAWKAWGEAQPPGQLARLAAGLHAPGPSRTPPGVVAFASLARLALAARSWPAELFPKDRPRVLETPLGRIALGTPGADTYEGDHALVVDPGGDDTYRRGRFAGARGTPGSRLGLLVDLGGADTYDSGEVDATLGAAILGAALLLDLGQGNDRYVGGHLTLGAAVGGVGVLYDDGGSDTYQGKTFTQGAAGYGMGVLLDDALQPAPALKTDEETKDPIAIAAWDNDRLSAWCTAQGFSRTLGMGLCVNTRGNEVYEAGGVYLHAPLFSDRYQSFSQGFSIGAREIDTAGGVAALVDLDGNDRYLGDIYDQGVGYWYSAGLLYDGGGHDLYEMTQYGQGSGIHLAVGGLVDVSGSDAYVMHSGLGQGGSHDYAASILHDRGGNDRYHGNTSCNGTGLTNSVGLHLDRAGDDTYAARRDGGWNSGRPARGFGSVGVLVDLGGKDDYLGPAAPDGPQDDRLWRSSDMGLGVDVAPAGSAAGGPGGNTPAADQPSGRAAVPAVVTTEAPLGQAVFDELWAISVRWEVGDNRVIVPLARKRLVAYGPGILPLLDGKVEKDESGLEIRAFADILGGLREAGAGDGVLAFLRSNLAGGPPAADPAQAARVALRRTRVALALVGEMKEGALAGEVAALLGQPDEMLARRAAGVLALLGSAAGNEVLRGWLARDEARILAALGALFASGEDAWEAARPLAGHALLTVRSRLATLLAERKQAYGARVLDALAQPGDLEARAVRTLLDAVLRAGLAPRAGDTLEVLAAHADWGVRADVARVLAQWVRPPAAAAAAGAAAVPAVAPAVTAALARLREDPDAYVRACARQGAP
ncbi:MAG: hypothetical protein ACKOSS_06120 [Planctomycetia bacterium]